MFIKAEGVGFTYMPGTPLAVSALEEVSFTIAKGEFVGIIGSSGSGKSTLLQILAGLLVPKRGRISIDGDFLAPPLLTKKLRNKTGIVFQNPEQQLFADTVYEDVAFGPTNMGMHKEEVEERVQEALSLVALDFATIKNRSPLKLSGGEMRRVALAGIIAMEPEVLLLDEPTAGLDPSGRKAFLNLVSSMHRKKNMTVLMISHSMDDIAFFARKILVFHQGRLMLAGSREEVFSRTELIKAAGLELPAVTAFMQALKSKGKNVNTGIFNIDDAAAEILRTVKREEC